ncbi:MAG: lasso peptide isopeptide bond-forming cyclase [Methanobacterium sp.]|nr:lasso peptide isopeptide bond-forming cyclase [Methanobacterium sp.]
MSGITGIFRRDGRDVDPADIKKMNDKIAHRGPDGSRVWCEGPVAFGHQMLHTTQESLHEILPFEDEESGLVITADARIDNRKDLAPQLGIEDNEHVSDSYFILKAYEKWGEKCPEELLGDFAFAIWDKNKEQLFCARDHMGVKPFYYYLSDNVFFFASQIKALHAFDEVPYKLNQLVAAFYLIPNSDETRSTLYKDIKRIPASHSFKLGSSKLQIKKYWELNPRLNLKLDSDDDYIRKFRGLFKKSVRCRLRSAKKIGFELSGGLDSSSIVTVSKDILTDQLPLQTFSLISKDFPESDESFYINKMMDSGGIEGTSINVDHISPLNNIDQISWHLEKPLYSANVSFFWDLYQKMEKKDIRVLLRGYDGDSILSHSEKYFKELFLKMKWNKLIKEIIHYSKNRDKDPYNIFLNRCIFPLIPYLIKKYWYRFKNVRLEGDLVLQNITLNRELNLSEIYKHYNKSLINPNTAKEFHYCLIVQGSHQFAFEYNDSLASAFSMEPRYPFFDKRLVEFCYAIPNEQKFRYGWDRMMIRRSIENLPNEIKWRSKKKFLTPVTNRNLIKFEEKRVNEIIYDKNQIYDRFIDPTEIKKLYSIYKTKNDDYQPSDASEVWKLITLTLWLEKEKII